MGTHSGITTGITTGITAGITARLTHHARQRCAEMGVGTKRVKRVLRSPALVRPSNGALLAISDDDPDIAVVYVEHDGGAVVVTVVWRTTVAYERTPGGWRARTQGAESRAA